MAVVETGEAQLLASLCGQLASFAPAMRMAPFMARWLHEVAELSADALTQEVEWGRGFLSFYQQHMPRMNGRRWDQDLRQAWQLWLEAASDASERGVGAHAFGGTWQLSREFSPAEQLKMDLGLYSSTEREVKAYIATLPKLLKLGHPCVHSYVGHTMAE